jgi:hypothetical protein
MAMPLVDNASMEFFEIVKGRRSVRLFTEQPVEDEKIERILETRSVEKLVHRL